MIQPRQIEMQPRIRNVRSARNATETRITRSGRARYANLIRVSAVLGCVLAMLMGYVMLTSNVTSMTYAIAKAQQDRDALREDTARLDDRLTSLRSDERLSKIATRLGMHEPKQFALVSLGVPVAQTPSRFAVLSSLTGWFGRSPHTRER